MRRGDTAQLTATGYDIYGNTIPKLQFVWEAERGLTIDRFGKISTVAKASSKPSTGLVNWWPGDGNADDVVGGSHGTLNGDVIFAQGIHGLAFRFDRTGRVNLGNLGAVPSEGTFDFWVKRSSVGYYPNPFTTNIGTFSNTIQFQAHPSNYLFVILGNPSGYTAEVNKLTEEFNLDTWHHVALVWRNGGSIIEGYGDGVRNFSNAQNPFFPTSFPEVGIGLGNACCWDGLLDEVAIYDRALTLAEIKDIYIAGSPEGQYTVTVRARYKDSERSGLVRVCVAAGSVVTNTFSNTC